MVRILAMGDRAYVQLKNKFMLCIGSKEEVDKADDTRIIQMVIEAIAWSEFYAIESVKGLTLH